MEDTIPCPKCGAFNTIELEKGHYDCLNPTCFYMWHKSQHPLQECIDKGTEFIQKGGFLCSWD